MKQIKHCPHCDAKMIEYKHSLNKRMIKCLYMMYENGGSILFSDLSKNKTFNDSANFQKLRYWNLIEKVKNDKGDHDKGKWRLTEIGTNFVLDKITLQKTAITYRNQTIGFEGNILYASEMDDYLYKKRMDYINDSVQHEMF